MIGKNEQQTLRTFAQDRLIKDMLSSSDAEAAKADMKPKGYILIVDNYTVKIVNSVVQMKDLVDHKIMGVELVSVKRKGFPSMQAIYFLEPTESNIRHLVDDVKNKFYEAVHLYFPRAIPDFVLELLQSSPQTVEKILSFKELNLDFLVVDDCQFTLDMKNCYDILYNKPAGHSSLLDAVSEKLFTLLSIFLPTNHLEVISLKNTMGDRVANQVVKYFKRLQEKQPELLSTDAKSIKVLILDRY